MSVKKLGMYKNLTNYGDSEFSIFLRKAFIKGMGYSEEMLNKPIIGITNTYSDYNPCHGNVPDLIKSVKAGILSSGAIPLEFPTISIHESFAYPTSMYLRNLMSIDTEEMMKAQPMDACVLIGGCDKTVPAQLMGAFSANIPAIQLVTGPMLTGSHRGERVGACTDCRGYWAKFRAEEIDLAEINEVNNQLVPTVGTCGVMGTASTMALITEALGMMISNGASAPAVSAERRRIAEETGKVAVEIANKSFNPKSFLTLKNFKNAYIFKDSIFTQEKISDESFDLVMSIGVIHHLSDPKLAPGTISAFYIGGVAVARGGAKPLNLPHHYDSDFQQIARYAKLAKSEEGFSEWITQNSIENNNAN